MFFSTLAAASLAGGTFHALSPGAGAPGRRILWIVTLVAMGGAALAAWIVALHMRVSPERVRVVARFLAIAFAGYCAVVLWVTDAYVVAIAAYLPAALFLLAVLVSAYRRTGQLSVLVGIIGLLLTFVAAGVQQLGLSLHAEYFDHNALYHVLQALGLFLLFRTASWSVEAEP